MKQKYISYWQQTLQHSQKLEFYLIFKNQYAPSHYLDLTTRTSERRILTKLRISNHKLMIELVTNQISRDNRLCQVCGSNQIEDEIHFPFHCSKYSIIRDNFYSKIQTLIPNIRQLPVNEQIIELMNSSNYFINLQLIRFITSCLILATNCYQCNLISIRIQLRIVSYTLSQYFKVYSHANKLNCCCCCCTVLYCTVLYCTVLQTDFKPPM